MKLEKATVHFPLTDELNSLVRCKSINFSGIKILDAGCYDGSFLARLRNNLFKYGVDIDKGAIELGKVKHQQSNTTLVCDDFTSFDLDGVTPDCITMYHVLEHLSGGLFEF